MTFSPICGSRLGKAATVRQRDGTHPPAAKRQALRDDVNAKNLEDLLRRQLLLGHILGVGQVERLVPWRDVRALFPADGGGHLSTSAGRGKTRDGAMPQHCRAALLLHHIQEAQVNVASRYRSSVSSFRGPSLLNPLTYLPVSHLPAEYHPLKYLRSVTSALRHSQAEQLLSGPERRIVRISRSSLGRALWYLLP